MCDIGKTHLKFILKQLQFLKDPFFIPWPFSIWFQFPFSKVTWLWQTNLTSWFEDLPVGTSDWIRDFLHQFQESFLDESDVGLDSAFQQLRGRNLGEIGSFNTLYTLYTFYTVYTLYTLYTFMYFIYCLSVCLSICLSIHPCILPSIYLSIYLAS